MNEDRIERRAVAVTEGEAMLAIDQLEDRIAELEDAAQRLRSKLARTSLEEAHHA